jgi:hypothetical protein
VVGDGRGGVAGIGRAALPREIGPESRPRPAWATTGGGAESVATGDTDPPVRLNLALLRQRLIGPALDAEGLAGPGDAAQEAVVLPFRR